MKNHDMQLIKQVCKEWNKENPEYHADISMMYGGNARIVIKRLYTYRGFLLDYCVNKHDNPTRYTTFYTLDSLGRKFDRYIKEKFNDDIES